MQHQPPIPTTFRPIAMVQALAAMAMVGGAVTASEFLTETPLFSAQAVRYALAAVVLLAARRAPMFELRRPVGRQWVWLVASATAGLSGYNLAVVRAVQHAEPAVVATVVACVPLVLAIGSPLVARHRPPIQLMLAATVVVIGATIIQGGGRSSPTGIAFAILALGGEAAFTLLAMPVLTAVGAFSVATHTSWIAAVELAVLAAVFDRADALYLPSGRAMLAIGYLVLASAAAFVLWFLAVQSAGGEVAGLAAGVIPVAAAATGLLVGVTTVDVRVGLGIAIVVIGVAGGMQAARHPVRRPTDRQLLPASLRSFQSGGGEPGRSVFDDAAADALRAASALQLEERDRL